MNNSPCGSHEDDRKQKDPSVITLYSGGLECPRYKPDQGLGQTLFHEVVHNCGLSEHDTTFFEIVGACTGWAI